MALKIVLATNNPGKIKEFTSLFANRAVTIVPRTNTDPIPETAHTFIENALLKARHAALETGLPALADDSGLVVPALNGEPGVFSARYAGKDATDEKNIKKLLHQLSPLSDNQRSAWFYCCLVFIGYPNDPCPLIASGTWSGEILHEPRGENGFGYDPVFWLPDLGKSAAELPPTEKNRISHRGKAIQSLLNQLAEIL